MFRKILIGWSLVVQMAKAQQDIPLGQWRTHLTYRDAHTVVATPQWIYCATSTGFFRVAQDGRQQVLSRVDGFSDAAIATMGYDSLNNQLIIIYANGNIDLLSSQGITNINSIRRFAYEPKRFHHVAVDYGGRRAFLSASFGLVELDLVSGRVRNSYLYLGNGGRQIEVFSSAVLGDTLFAATSEGLKKASLRRGLNLADSRNWISIPLRIPTQVRHTVAFGGSIYFTVNFDSLYRYRAGKVEGLPIAPRQNQYLSLSVSQEHLVLGLPGIIVLINSQDQSTLVDARTNRNFIEPRSVVWVGQDLWIADLKRGLIRLNLTSVVATSYNPNGVYSASIGQIAYGNGQILVTAGGFRGVGQPMGNPNGFYVFSQGIWQSYNAVDSLFGSVRVSYSLDMTAALYDRKRQQWILGSYGGGLFRLKGDSLIKYPESLFFRITSLTQSPDGTIYAARHPEGGGGCVLKLEGDSWVLIPSPVFQPDEIISDNSGFLYLRSPNEIIVLNPKTAETVSSTQSGSLFADKIFTDMALNPSGGIWVATDDGILEMISLASTFKQKSILSRTPRINQERALRDTPLNTVAVDGGGQVWVGADDGLRLFDAQFSQLLEHFTVANSPLLSDKVTQITANPLNGEVFVGTSLGLISYRTASVEATFGVEQSVRVFPNPVLPGFSGLVGITGITRDGIVKITDASGAMIRELKASGGAVGWDCNDYNGQRAKPGIYYVFMIAQSGEQSFLAKIALVN